MFRRLFPVDSSRRRLARRLYERVLPKRSRRRDLFSSVMVIVWELRNAAIRTRVEWRRQRGERNLRHAAMVRYEDWYSRVPPDDETLAAQRRLATGWPRPPAVRVVVVEGLGGSRHESAATAASLAGQTWEAAEVRTATSGELAQEFRHLSANHPDDLAIVVRAGDRLRADALFEVAQAAWRDPLLELVYWDDDLDEVAGVWEWMAAGQPNGVYTGQELRSMGDPRVKPGWSPDLLTCANYIGRSFALRARWLDPDAASRHGAAEPSDDSLWWEVLLQLDVDDERVLRVPQVLQLLAGRNERVEPHHLELVDRWLARHDWPATAEMGPGGVVPRWHLDDPGPVSVIIPTRHNRKLMKKALDLVRAADWPDLELIIVDNGGRSPGKEAWYADHAADLAPTVIWWDEPFNYSAVNNRAAAQATGEVLVFLNDDTALDHPGWLANLWGWAKRPEVGVVGLQLIDGNGLIQHGGVVLGMHGFADHLFQGMAPHSDSLLGSTDWTRNAVATTGACLAVRRSVFEEVGGFDERLVLCGSDVVLGLDARHAGYRNVVSVATPVRHLESATRGAASDPAADVFTSYWFYQRWLMGGDPHWSPSLSADHTEPALRSHDELTVLERLSWILHRPMEVFSQSFGAEGREAKAWAPLAEADRDLSAAIAGDHRARKGRHEVRTVNWFVPEFQNPFYGGIHTAFRLADHLAARHGVESRFMVIAEPRAHNPLWYRSGMAAAFPSLADSEVVYHDVFSFDPALVPPADAAMATMWTTAYFVAHTPEQARRFYLIQDYEPMFHPAGSLYALAEQSYRLGLYGLCNTGHLADLYRGQYGGIAEHFWPAVDPRVFHDQGRSEPDPDRPVTVFVYARPSHFRNCWELAAEDLRTVKDQLGEGVRIVTAGSWTPPQELDAHLVHRGQLDYRETGDLYRTCDIGIALTVSEHPSYLPLELMACGAAVMAFDNPAGDWLLRDDHNCVRTPQTANGLAAEIAALAHDPARRQRLAKQGLADIAARHASWEQNMAGVYDYLCDPESRR